MKHLVITATLIHTGISITPTMFSKVSASETNLHMKVATIIVTTSHNVNRIALLLINPLEHYK